MSDVPPTPEVPDVERLTADHEKFKLFYNEHDKNSPVYQRPDLAKAKRDEIDLNFQAMLIRHGATPLPPVTPESFAQADFDRAWKFTDALPHFVTELAASAEKAAATMSTEAKDAAVVAIQREAGEQRYAEMVAAGRIPPGDKAHFIQLEGQRRYEELVRQAEATLKPGEKLNPGALIDGTLLVNLAAHGRSVQQREIERAKMTRR